MVKKENENLKDKAGKKSQDVATIRGMEASVASVNHECLYDEKL